MKKAKQVFALVLALVMLLGVAVPTAFAKTNVNVYEPATLYPTEYDDGVEKAKFTVEQGAGYVLDLLDKLLLDLNLDLSQKPVVDEWYAKVTLKANLTNIDNALYFIGNLVNAINVDSDLISNVANIKIIGIGVTGLAGKIVSALNLGDIESLTVTALGDQNGASRICRNVPYDSGKPGKSDLTVLRALVQFLADNKDTLAKIADGSINFGTLDGTIKGIEAVKPYLNDLPNALRKLLYSKLVNTDFNTDDALPSGTTVDSMVQSIINWLLIDGTGYTAETGGKSVLGEGKEAFLPAMNDYPGGASIDNRFIYADRDDGSGVQRYRMNFYQLVNNALNALLSGYVSDMLEGLLFDMLDIDASDDLGDPELMTDVMFSTIVGAVEGLCVQNGAPEIVYSSDAQTYPVPKIRELLDWFFNGGGLATFVKISYSGIQITDNFMSLLNDVARMLPGLFGLFGFEVPDGLTYTNEEMTQKWVDLYPDEPYYVTFDGRDVIKFEDNGNDYDYDDDYEFVSNGLVVNTTNPTGEDYCNPKFIRPKYVKSNQNIYAALVKILLNNFIDGCYFPDWAEDIPSVGAYALASLVAKYLPENNYFDRLDAYHYGSDYIPKGTSGTVIPLPYTEVITLKTGTEVTVPRAAMDIAASLGAYLLSGWQDFQSGVGYVLETDTNFEVFAFEFLTWACATYMPIFAGKWNASTANFGNLDGGITGTWQTAFVTARNTFNGALANHPQTGATGNINNIPAGEIRNALYDLLDATLFKLIPFSWLPDWVSGEKSAGLINIWLLQSICTLDLQKIISILGINSEGELNESVSVVLLRLVDRVLGTVVGGNPLLPESSRANVFDANTSVTTLDGLLGSTQYTPLKTLLERLLYQLNRYIPTLAAVIFPLLLSGSVKKAEYYTSATSSQTVNYIGTGVQITPAQLRIYNDENAADANSEEFSGTVWYTTPAKAETVASDIGAAGVITETINGAEKYGVTFPATYSQLTKAQAAAGYIDNAYAKRDSSANGIVYKIYVSENYRDATANEQAVTLRTDPVTGAITEKKYVYTNIHTAAPVKSNGTYQTGTHGEVVYGDGWRTFSYEDFRSNQIKLYHRYKNAIDDSNDFLGDFDTYTQKTLPDAYGAWLMYFINMQLYNNKHYDQNGDGSITSADGMPGCPGEDTPYPFLTNSGTAYETYLGPEGGITQVRNVWKTGSEGKAYTFSSGNSFIAVQEALNYADALEEDGKNHNVLLSRGETQSVVRLALNNHTFDITSGSEADAEAEWNGLSTDGNNSDISKISSLCQALSLIFDASAHTISRKSFALIPASLNGKTAFGVYSTDQTGSGTAISITPASTFTAGGENEVALQNEIQEAYITFAKGIRDYSEKLNDYYDNISWRLSNAELALEGNTVRTNTLDWVLAYTADAYMTEVDGEMWRNKYINTFGDLATHYTAKTYDEFQKAYEYGLALKDAVENNQHILQSLITTAYQAILKAYYNLHLFDAKPDWSVLEATMAQASAILTGPLGLGPEVDRDVAYTLASLNNLNDCLADTTSWYNQYRTDADIDYQGDIDEYNRILKEVIEALKWPQGLIPGAIKVSDPDYNSPLTILNNGTEDYSYGLGGLDTLTYKVIVGLQEGQSFTDENGSLPLYPDGERVFTSNGYVEDSNTNTFRAQRGNYGGGTGSYLVGFISRIPQFKYYAVIVGDLNGDSRIDGVDRTYINLIDAQDMEDEIETYIAIAGDVNFDGHVDENDATIIDLKVKHDAAYPGISQSASDVNAEHWFDAT